MSIDSIYDYMPRILILIEYSNSICKWRNFKSSLDSYDISPIWSNLTTFFSFLLETNLCKIEFNLLFGEKLS